MHEALDGIRKARDKANPGSQNKKSTGWGKAKGGDAKTGGDGSKGGGGNKGGDGNAGGGDNTDGGGSKGEGGNTSGGDSKGGGDNTGGGGKKGGGGNTGGGGSKGGSGAVVEAGMLPPACVVCGDMNSQGSSAVRQLLLTGEVGLFNNLQSEWH